MPQQPYRTRLAGWGRFPVVDGLEWKSENLAAITEKATLCRGLGRSYGDSSLPARADLPVADTTLADRLLSFDPVSGLLRAEAGVSLLGTEPRVPPPRLVRARLARHPVRHPRRHDRLRRAWQEPPRRRLFRPARSQHQTPRGRRADRRMLGNLASRNCSAPRSAAWD